MNRRNSGLGLWLRRGAWAAAIGLLVLWVVGCWRYTSVGFEFEAITDEGVMREDMYRVRWPGDGSVMVGGGTFHRPADAKVLEPFDLGAVFFRAPQPREPQSGWNRHGFWRVRTELPGAEVPALSRQSEFWWGVPGWLPGALVLGLMWLLGRQARGVAGKDFS